MKEKYVKLSDVTYAINTGIVLAEIPTSFIQRIGRISTIEMEEPQEISIEKAKRFADYYRNDVLNRDKRTIDEHFIIFCNP